MTTEDREGLERRAIEVRERLRRKLELLDDRGRGIVRTAGYLRSLLRPIAIAAATAMIAGIFVAGAAAQVAKRRARRRAALRAFTRPITELARPRRPSFLQEAGRKLLMSGLTVVGSRLLRWSADRLLSSPTDPRADGA